MEKTLARGEPTSTNEAKVGRVDVLTFNKPLSFVSSVDLRLLTGHTVSEHRDSRFMTQCGYLIFAASSWVMTNRSSSVNRLREDNDDDGEDNQSRGVNPFHFGTSDRAAPGTRINHGETNSVGGHIER